jgi:hypothetical protein
MELLTTYQEPDFSSTNSRTGRMATRKVYKCPVCGKERTTDGRGKVVR